MSYLGLFLQWAVVLVIFGIVTLVVTAHSIRIVVDVWAIAMSCIYLYKLYRRWADGPTEPRGE